MVDENMLKMKKRSITQIRSGVSLKWELCNALMALKSGSIEGKQLNLCRGYVIFCHIDCLCLQEIKGR